MSGKYGRRAYIVAISIAFVAAACGSTAPRGAVGAGAGALGASSSSVGTEGSSGSLATGTSGLAGLSGPAGTTGLNGPAGTSGSPATGSTGTGSTGTTGPGGPLGPGVTASTVKIGLHLADPGQDAVLDALGVKGVSTGDEKGEAEAVIAYINAHGGAGGRKIVPVYQYYATSTDSFDTQYEAACAAFTQDTKVFAAISTAEYQQLNVLASCLKSAGSILVFQNRLLWDQQDFDQYAPYVYSPSYLRGDRWGPVVDELVSEGFFGRGAKVGLLYMDTPTAIRVMNQVVVPHIKASGARIAAEASLPDYDDVAGLGSAATAMSGAVLQFRSDGVNEVFSVGTNGTAYFFFPGVANSQNYHPRYGFDSTEIPEIVASNAPASQLHGALGVGWWPTYDVDTDQDPNDNPTTTLCDNMFAAVDIHPTTRFADNDAIDICDALLFITNGLNHATAPNATAFRAAVDGLGSSYKSPFTFGTQFGPGRFDGASEVRPEAYVDACSCWKYTGPPVPIP